MTGTTAVPVLHTYISKVRVTRPYFDASAESSEEELLAEVPEHPVFRLTQAALIGFFRVAVSGAGQRGSESTPVTWSDESEQFGSPQSLSPQSRVPTPTPVGY